MSLRTDVLLWAQRVIARKGSPPHVLLELTEHATGEEVQNAFHKIARTAHPDLHRTGLDAAELELVTSAYATVAGAYQQMRTQCLHTQRLRALEQQDAAKAGATGEPRSITPPTGTSEPRSFTPPTGTAEPRGSRGPASPPSAMARPTGALPLDFASMPSTPPVPATPATPSTPAKPSGPAPSGNAAQSMSPKALLYFRKAELCLKRGDLKGAILQLKLACATDPTSAFLRTALAEVEIEVRKR
jgi:hypothetical protein